MLEVMVADNIHQLNSERFKKFHRQCAAQCGSSKAFKANFIVNRTHIYEGTLKNPARAGAISNEMIAAVIQSGFLNEANCNASGSLEVALEGILNNFEWVDKSLPHFPRQVMPKAWIRVVLRQTKPRTLVVTLYVNDFNQSMHGHLPEVDHEIW